ncbi:MAG: hypothetical protein KDB07_05775 [Planctomycetes bacterium]|nr:hypothetical protein [Planctomycetota bacterium]
MKIYLTLAAIVALFLVIGPQSSFGQRNKDKNAKQGPNESLRIKHYSERRVQVGPKYKPLRNREGEIDDVLSPQGRAHLRLRAHSKRGKFNAFAVDSKMKVTSDASNDNLFVPDATKKRKKYDWSSAIYQDQIDSIQKTNSLAFEFNAPPRMAVTLSIKGSIHLRFLADVEDHTSKELTRIKSKQTVFSNSKLGIKVRVEPDGEDRLKFTWEGDLFRISAIEWIGSDDRVESTTILYPHQWDGFESVQIFTGTLKYSCRLRLKIAKTVNIEEFEIDHEHYKLP